MGRGAGRREQIGDAGVRLIARDGVHALTHLHVDTEAGLPRGSTSYYARTRRDLLTLVVNRLSEGSQSDIADVIIPASLHRHEAAGIAADILAHMARRSDAQAARGALLFELRDDAELREALTAKAPVREPLTRLAEQVLTSAGVSDAATRAPDLVGLVDALLMYQAAEAAPVDTRAVLTAYLEGLD